MRPKHMNIRTKLAPTFAVLAVTAWVVTGISLKSLFDANDHFSECVRGLMALGNAAKNVRRSVEGRAVAVRNLELVTKAADLETEEALVHHAHADV